MYFSAIGVTIELDIIKPDKKKVDDSTGKTVVGISFRVQIVTSSEPIELYPANFKGLEGVREYSSNDMFKYSIGDCKTLGEASELQAKARESGYGGAFIVAFENDIRIDLKKALTLIPK